MSKARTATPRARLFWAAGISLACAVFLALGTWQLFRMQWKQELIARVNQRAHAAPVAVPSPSEWPSLTADNAEYRHVQVSGTLLLDRSILVQASTQLGPGFWVMTPLQTSSGDIVLVNRGYIADRKADTGSGTAPATVTGLLRPRWGEGRG